MIRAPSAIIDLPWARQVLMHVAKWPTTPWTSGALVLAEYLAWQDDVAEALLALLLVGSTPSCSRNVNGGPLV